MKKLVFLIAFICITTSSKAQINEIGLFAGGSNYIGDIGPEYYIYPNNFMGGLIYKWNMNPRIALRGTFTYAELSSNDADATNQARFERGMRFTNSIKELALGVEFNYLEYNLDNFKSSYTPYLLLEVAAFNYNVVATETAPQQYEYESKIGYAIPFGIGFKTKLAGDFAIALELRARYTFTDDIDYNNFKTNSETGNYIYDSLTFGNPNSNDWYILSGISLVYTFGRPACYATPY